MGLDLSAPSDSLDLLDIPGRLSALASVIGDKTAVLSQRGPLTFSQLQKEANCIAHALVEIAPPASPLPVVILLESSAAIITSIYGVLQAGHFYCVISPAEPRDHIAGILNDLGEIVVITETSILDRVQEILPSSARILFYDHLDGSRKELFRTPIRPDTLVGIFYTSGSSGTPKGVMRAHHDIQYLIRNFGHHLGFRSQDRILALRPFPSVSSAVDIFGGLLNGATLVTYDFKAGGVGELVDALKAERITIFRPPVQMMRSFLDLIPEDEFFPDLRLFFATGDVLYKKDVERMRRIIPRDAFVIHQLASSEAGLLTVNRIAHDTPLPEDIVSVGVPLPGQEILILDETGGLVTDHRLGEIGVCGDYLFPGYWRHPEWTRDAYTIDPRDPSRRIYRSGDMGRLLPNGQLEFAGRSDSRVKIKGYSVDLNAVDLALQKIRGVSRSVTVVQSNPSGAKRLVSYVQAEAEYVLTPSDLRKQLLRKLPDYMVPFLFVPVDVFPFTSAGKLNRKALPLPDWKQSQASTEYVPPRDEIETVMVQLWQKVFGIDQVGMLDSFFDLGGDSLLASALFVEIEIAFGKRFPLSILLKFSTVEKLTAIVRSQNASSPDRLTALRVSGKNPPLFLAPGGGADTITLVDLAAALGEDQPVYGLEDLYVGTPRSIYSNGLAHAAREFILAIQNVQPRGPYYIGGHSFGGLVAYEIARQLRAAGEQVGLLLLIDTNAPSQPDRSGKLSGRLKTHRANLAGKSLREVLEYFMQRFRRRTSRLARKRWFQRLLRIQWLAPLLWQDNRRYVQLARSEYVPGTYEGDTKVYRATERPPAVTWDMTAAWRTLIAGRLEYFDVPGSHIYMIKYPHVEHLARLIMDHLESAFRKDRRD